MPDSRLGLSPLRPMWLTNDDDGIPALLASSRDEALAEAQRYYACDDVAEVVPDGWMMDVGWDRENYERKRDFLAETGYTGWWESVGGSHDSRVETKKLRRAWEVVLRDA